MAGRSHSFAAASRAGAAVLSACAFFITTCSLFDSRLDSGKVMLHLDVASSRYATSTNAGQGHLDTRTRARAHTHAHARTRTHAHTRAHTRARAHEPAHAHTYIYTRAYSRACECAATAVDEEMRVWQDSTAQIQHRPDQPAIVMSANMANVVLQELGTRRCVACSRVHIRSRNLQLSVPSIRYLYPIRNECVPH